MLESALSKLHLICEDDTREICSQSTVSESRAGPGSQAGPVPNPHESRKLQR